MDLFGSELSSDHPLDGVNNIPGFVMAWRFAACARLSPMVKATMEGLFGFLPDWQ